jgi:hypothetical protein
MVAFRVARVALVAGLLASALSGCVTRAAHSSVPTAATSSATTHSWLPECWIGTWLSTLDVERFVFSRGMDQMTFTGFGVRRTLRPDGTAVVTMENFTMSAPYNGTELRVVFDGTAQYNWSATQDTFTYGDFTRNDTVITQYQDDRKLASAKDRIGTRHWTLQATCADDQATEVDHENGFHVVWKRVTPT